MNKLSKNFFKYTLITNIVEHFHISRNIDKIKIFISKRNLIYNISAYHIPK